MKLLLLILVLSMLTVVIHSLGTYISISSCIQLLESRARYHWIRSRIILIWLVTSLLMTHLLEIGLWAFVYYQWGMLPDPATSVYYSLTSYSTVGYGDVLLPHAWRLLGPAEAMVGVLMLGWSTAMIVTVVQKTFRPTA